MGPQQTNTTHRWKGLAMEALPDNSVTLRIFCPELTPGGIQGSFAPGIVSQTVKTTNISGSSESATATIANHITAIWQGDSNESYPPSVAKGEQVWVFQQGNTDKFYWSAAGRDREKRTFERHRTEVAATPNLNEDKTDQNTYFEDWNSKQGYVTLLKSSKANGEPYAIYIGVDTKTGKVIITDDKGVNTTTTTDASTGTSTTSNKSTGYPCNQFVMDFANDVFQFTNNQKTSFRIDGQDVFVDSPRDIMYTAGRQILFNAPLITFNKSQAGAVLFNVEYFTINSTSDVVINAVRFGVNAVTKIAGVLVAAASRFVSICIGSLGSSYTGGTGNLTNGSFTAPSNSTDNDISASGDKHVAAWEDVDKAFQATAQAITEVAEAVPTSVDTSGITSNSAKAEMQNIKGT